MGGKALRLRQVFAANCAQVVDRMPTDTDVHRTWHPEHGRTLGHHRLGIRQLVGGTAPLDSSATTCEYRACMFRSDGRQRDRRRAYSLVGCGPPALDSSDWIVN